MQKENNEQTNQGCPPCGKPYTAPGVAGQLRHDHASLLPERRRHGSLRGTRKHRRSWSRLYGQATQKYTNVNAAINAGYHPVLGCVSGPDHGAMGVHYLNASLLNGEVDATQPQALIYEPLGGGRMRLVGVEFIVDAATWEKKNAAPPQLYQQLLQLIPSPNRYGLDTFYELHVWAWQDNPNGAFVDWNNKVNCNLQGTTL